MKKKIMAGLIGLLIPILSSCSSGWQYSSRSYEPQDWELFANKPKTALNENFAWGVDVSSLKEVEAGGGKFYDKDGSQQDVFKILNDGGANYARFRIWNNPYDDNGKPYGGGTNDLKTDIELAKRAQAAGMQILVDFHYSDSWVDPGKYWAPRAWKGMEFEQKSEALAEFTRTSLEAFKNAGITVNSVQLGNEINPGIAGIGSNNYMRIGQILAKAGQAAKSVFPSIKTVAHYTNINSPDQIFVWLERLKEANSLPDVIGYSYYPYWHGTLENLQSVLDKTVEITDKEVAVLETSWGYTDEWAEYCNNQFSTETFGFAGGYTTSTQGQVTELADIADVLSKVPGQKGAGIFYWEPAWLPNAYSGWITKEGAYYNDTGKDWGGTEEALAERYGESYGYSSWANQAWFDYKGKVLPSAYAYRHIQCADHTAKEEYQKLLESETSGVINLNDEWKLPPTARVITNLGAYRDVAIDYPKSETDKIKDPGYYEINATCAGFPLKVNVKAELNYVKDGDFEKQGVTTSGPVVEPWKVETTTTSTKMGDAHIEAKGELGGQKGNQYFHWYSTSPFEFKLTQDLGTIRAGQYDYGMSMRTSWYEGGGTEGAIESSTLYVEIDGVKQELDIRKEHIGYNGGIHEVSMPTIALEKDAKVVIGFTCKAAGGAWGHADDFHFSAIIE